MDGFCLMQLFKSILIAVTTLISATAFFLPYWFTVTMSVSLDAGKTYIPLEINMGLFYMDKGTGINMADLIFVEKASNAQLSPPFMRVGQIFFGLGVTGMFVCFVASIIYTCRKYKTATGELCLAGGMLPSSISLIIGVILALFVASDASGGSPTWQSFPVPGGFVQVKVFPDVGLSYGFYAAAAGALLGIGAVVLSWIQACSLCRHVEQVRYQMLFAPLTDDERGVGGDVKIHHFRHKPTYRYDERDYSKPRREVNF